MSINSDTKEYCEKCDTWYDVLPDFSDTHDCELNQFERVINRIADIERKIDGIDNTIQKTATFVENIQKEISPLVDKLVNNPVLKGFFK